ncbi:MAG: flagellar basal body P-ring protein FlgI [Planctomycetota bacterium]
MHRRTLKLIVTGLLATLPAARLPAQSPLDAMASTSTATATGAGIVEPRIRDITRLHNVMPHLLVGFGLVTGLGGTGASDRGTRQAILNMVRDQGLNLSIADVVGGNTALVSLTASVQPFAKQGQPIDVKVQTIGDATSLRGGQLMRAELRGVDGQTHVVVQGPVLVGGFSAQGSSASVQKNLSTTGWVNNGGIVVRDMNSSFFSEAGDLELQVTTPSAYNAASIAAGVRTALSGQDLRVAAVDPTLVRIELPREARTNENAMAILNRIGQQRVPVENPAKIVVDQTSGTVLAGEGVLISPCVVGLTDLTISIVEEEQVSQPEPLSQGETTRVPRTNIQVQSNSTELKPIAGGATVSELLQNLKSLGLTPAQLVSVFQALDDGGFLHAELEVR